MKRNVDWEYIQTIKRNYKIAFLNHFTRIENLGGILEEGGLVAKHKLKRYYIDISNQGIQEARSNIEVVGSGKKLHEFVPLYFCVKSPMISVLRTHNNKIVYLQFALDLLKLTNIFLADGNARDKRTSFYEYENTDTLKNLDVSAINTVKYAHCEETKRKKQAEILVPEIVPKVYLYNIACFSDESKKRAIELLNRFGLKSAVKTTVSPNFYYHR